jgi:HAD superfamily hydrolase (TIGR01549 family)
MIPAILLDYGGTLDSDGVHWLDRFYAIYDGLGPASPPRPRIKEAFYAADAEIARDPLVGSWRLGELMRRHVAAQFRTLGIADPALEGRVTRAFVEPSATSLRQNRVVLAALKAHGCRLGIVSNFYGNLLTICDEFGLTPELDTALDSAIVGLSKPDPRFFALALERLGRPAGETVFVGDSLERDVRPAKSIGMRTVWLRDDLETPGHEAGLVDLTIEHLSDLPAAIAAWPPGACR